MSRQRRNFSAKFKSDLVIELLKGEKDLNTLNGLKISFLLCKLHKTKSAIMSLKLSSECIVSSVYLFYGMITR